MLGGGVCVLLTAGGALGDGMTGAFTFLVGCSGSCRGPHEASASSKTATQSCLFIDLPPCGTAPATVRSFRQQNSARQGEFPMADDRDDVERERTTVVETGGGGGGGVLAVVILIIVVLVLLYIFRGQLGLGHTNSVVPSTVNINVNHS
jgi:hypothetical protein